MGKLKDYVPSVNDVVDDPAAGGWLSHSQALMRSYKHGQREQRQDAADAERRRQYKLSHPDPLPPSRRETQLTGARQAARRRTGRINTVLTDMETLG